MEPHVSRQIKDIQHWADRIINGRPSLDEIQEFDQYNEELKAYLLENLTEKEIITRVKIIPRAIEGVSVEDTRKTMLFALLGQFTFLTSYIIERRKIDRAKNCIHDIKSQYSSIEFLTRNL